MPIKRILLAILLCAGVVRIAYGQFFITAEGMRADGGEGFFVAKNIAIANMDDPYYSAFQRFDDVYGEYGNVVYGNVIVAVLTVRDVTPRSME